jgi:hypothetical protein
MATRMQAPMNATTMLPQKPATPSTKNEQIRPPRKAPIRPRIVSATIP